MKKLSFVVAITAVWLLGLGGSAWAQDKSETIEIPFEVLDDGTIKAEIPLEVAVELSQSDDSSKKWIDRKTSNDEAIRMVEMLQETVDSIIGSEKARIVSVSQSRDPDPWWSVKHPVISKMEDDRKIDDGRMWYFGVDVHYTSALNPAKDYSDKAYYFSETLDWDKAFATFLEEKNLIYWILQD